MPKEVHAKSTDDLSLTIKFSTKHSIGWILLQHLIGSHDLKMLESIISVPPSDWFSLSGLGWPRFQMTKVTEIIFKAIDVFIIHQI